MGEMQRRAQTQFPIVLLTLISIIQALALELLWNKVSSSDFLYEVTLNSIVGWGMISVLMMGILQLWIMYSTLVIGFVWRPSLRDSVLPFVIGIQEFMLVSLISEQFNVMWLYVLASLFLVGNVVAHLTFRRAREDAANHAFFKNREPAQLKDFADAFIVISTLVGLGMVSTALGSGGLIALTAIGFANAALAFQILSSRRLWRLMLEGS